MRMLFNHGLTADNFYINTPDRITTKNKQFFKNLYGHFNSREDALSAPFKYCIGIIINKIISERLRFKIPVSSSAYIDFEVITEDLFEVYKQRGAFNEIDFIESDFTGYYLRYFYKTRSYQKKVTIHLGGDLKKKFLHEINNGTKLYTTKDFTLKDVLNEVHLQFKEIDKKELYKILLHGFRRMHSSILYGCYISINSKRFTNCYAFFGELRTNPIKQAEMYNFRIVKKIRIISIWQRKEFDNYYYIGLTPKIFNKWVDLNKKNRVHTTFEKVMVRSLLEEVLVKAKEIYIFKYKVKKWRGFNYWEETLKVRDIEFIGISHSGKLKYEDKSWKQLIKENMNKINIENE